MRLKIKLIQTYGCHKEKGKMIKKSKRWKWDSVMIKKIGGKHKNIWKWREKKKKKELKNKKTDEKEKGLKG